jgi:hypothetical protein
MKRHPSPTSAGAVSLCALATAFAALITAAPARAAFITNSDIFPTTGREVGSGNGTLDLILFTESAGGTHNTAGSFNGDDANTGMPTGANRPTAAESYITSIGEIRSFYRLNFPDGFGGSTVSNMGLFVDINQIGQVSHLNLDDLRVVIDYNANFTPASDGRNNPAASDISSASQNATKHSWTGGTVARSLDSSPKVLPLNNQGAGFADQLILTNVNPFDPAYSDNSRLLIHWESSNHDDGGETIFLSGAFAPQDIVTPEPASLASLAIGLLALKRRH